MKGQRTKKTILVTGGAGYIGSVTIEGLHAAGYLIVVLDNMSEGHRSAIPHDVPLYIGNVGDRALLDALFTSHQIDAVMHFAALALVGESVKFPERYHENNVTQTVALLDAMAAHHVQNIVFSSSCTVFGEPQYLPLDEEHPFAPINPYGQTKLAVEMMLRERNEEYGLRSCSLRYFNAAGATLHNGEDRKLETHIIPLALDTVRGLRDHMEILGADYPTKDGTCVRDYIHVHDLARVHVMALEHLERSPMNFYNLGNGNGYTVREVLAAVERVTGKKVPVHERPRRPGDAGVMIASAALAQAELGWEPQYTELEPIIESAWMWRQQHSKGYSS